MKNEEHEIKWCESSGSCQPWQKHDKQQLLKTVAVPLFFSTPPNFFLKLIYDKTDTVHITNPSLSV